MAETSSTSKTQWHTIFGALLKPLLTPVGVEVTPNVAERLAQIDAPTANGISATILGGDQKPVGAFPQQFWAVIKSLWEYWFLKEQKTMNVEMTPEELEAMDQFWGEHFLSTLTEDDFFYYMTPDKILDKVTPEGLLDRLTPEKLLDRLNPADFLAKLKPEDIIAKLKPEDVLARLEPEDRLAGLKPEEIEEYLKKLKEEEEQS